MRQKFGLLLSLGLLLLGLWPPSLSLRETTGEEELLAQLRGLGQWFYTAVRPPLDLAPAGDFFRADGGLRGVNTFLEQEVLPEVRDESLRLIAAAGFGHIRQQFPWFDIEIHGQNDFVDRRNDANGVDAWAKYDQIVDLSEKHGLAILARLDHPPAWSRGRSDAETGPFAPPDQVADYGDFVAAVAGRYRGRIRYYQLWNEPNIYPEWGEQPVSPEGFTPFLCEGYRRIKAADPEAFVIAPAFAPTVALNYRDLNNLVYLQRLYDDGAGACFDILAAQGYGLFSGAYDYRLRPTVINYPHHLFLRDLMVKNGDAAKPLWVTEMGWNAVPEGLPEPFGRVDEALQARYTLEAYERMSAEWPWVAGGTVWFFKRAADYEKDQPFYYFRLMEPDFTPHPVYEGLAGKAPERSDPGRVWLLVWNGWRRSLTLAGGGLLLFLLLGSWQSRQSESRSIDA